MSTTSSPQTVSLINTASVPLNISGITFTGANPGDYAQTNDCGASLAAGANCSINVTFTPTAEGTRAALVNVSDDAIGSPQQIALVGTGLAPVVVLNPTSLTFPTQTVGTLSTFQYANLTNAGNLPLSISSITVSGEFFEGNNCKSSLAAGASCTIRVAFRPTTKGPQSGAVTLVDGAGTQTVPLSGSASFLSVSPTSIAFGNVPVGSTSVPHTVTVQNVSANQITFGGVLIKGANSADFAETNTCGTGIPAKGSCTVNVTFTPSKKAFRSTTLKISGGGGVFSVALSGNGT